MAAKGRAGSLEATISVRSSYARAKVAAWGGLEVARISIARKQKRKTKSKARKVVRRRAMPAGIKVLDTQRPADEVRSRFGVERATSAEAGKRQHESGVTIRASASRVSENCSHAMRIATQALQLLLALPLVSLQIWQNAILGGRRLER